MVSFSRLFAAESLALVGATVPFPTQNGTLLLREQTRSCLRKACRDSLVVTLSAASDTATCGSRLRGIAPPSAIRTRPPEPLILARQHRGPGAGGFPPSRGGVARALGRRR